MNTQSIQPYCVCQHNFRDAWAQTEELGLEPLTRHSSRKREVCGSSPSCSSLLTCHHDVTSRGLPFRGPGGPSHDIGAYTSRTIWSTHIAFTWRWLESVQAPSAENQCWICIECCKFYVRGIKTPTVSGIDYLPLVTNGWLYFQTGVARTT